MSGNEHILLTGATGFIGRALVENLVAAGYRCTVITRATRIADGLLPAGVTVGGYTDTWPMATAVVNLAGESVAGWWTRAKRRRILASRIHTTGKLVAWMRETSPKPAVFLSMSAVGIYGDRPGERLTEESAPDPAGKFRAQVTLAWEAEALKAEALGVRVVRLRLGNVLHPDGGYLKALLRGYRFLPICTLAGRETMLAWISRRDAINLICFALENEAIRGPLNLAAPNPVSHREFAELVAAGLGRRAWGQLPGPAMRLGLGDFADAILDSQEVLPARALAAGFHFADPELGPYLESVLRKTRPLYE